jgi:RNA polymerase sigma-70 factor, ECF subfamily
MTRTSTLPSGAARSGGADPEQIEAVYRSRHAQLVRVAWAIAGDREGAHDAVQEGFARALRARSSFRGHGSLEGWLWRAVVNAARDRRRARTLVPAEALPERAAAAEDDDHGGVRAMVMRLPERQRTVLFLRYYADLDYAAIAAALDIQPGTVGATLNAAHAALRAMAEESR